MAQNRATLEEVREFCNTVREAGGANILDALLPAIPEKTNECLIARNLNFSCRVFPDEGFKFSDDLVQKLNAICNEGIWVMEVKDEELAKRISEAIGSEYNTDYTCQEYDGKGKPAKTYTGYQILLPGKIGRAAELFDSTFNYVFSSDYLYDEDPNENPADYFDPALFTLIEEGTKTKLAEAVISSHEYNPEENEKIPEIVKAVLSDQLKELGTLSERE